MNGKSLPPSLLKMIQSALEPGEEIVWTGQPRITPSLLAAFLVAPTGMLVAYGIFSWWLSELAPFGWVLLYGTVCVYGAVPFVLCAGQSWRLRNTAYVLTSHRAIAFVPHWRLGYRVYVNLPEDLGCSRCVRVFGSLGTIAWVERPIKGTGYLAGNFRGSFALIDHVKDVERLMHETFLPRLVQGLKSTSPDVRRKSIVGLGRIGRIAKQAIPFLIDALASEDSVIRRHAADALGRIGKESYPAVPGLKRMVLVDEDRTVAETARRAVERIRTPRLV